MSIIIKGLSMPQGDEEIRLRIDAKGEVYIYGAYPTQLYEAIELPPHGRLIEADAVVNQLKAVAPNGSSGWVYYNGLCQIIKITPTIIEAEGKK